MAVARHPTPISTRMRTSDQSGMQQEFLHAVDLSDDLACYNISLHGKLASTGFINENDPGGAQMRTPLRSVSDADLRYGVLQDGALSPRVARFFVPAAIWDAGQELVNGYGEPMERSKVRATSERDSEVAFEIGRRKHNPSASSRLTCIFLTESSDDGRAAIAKMFRNRYILELRVLYEQSLTRVDGGWYGAYQNNQREDFVRSYWNGEPYRDPAESAWEYLFEGVLELAQPDQLEYVRTRGKKLTGTRPLASNQ